MPKIAIMAAMSTNRVIGLNDQLPWHLPADLQRVQKIATGKTFIMGKNTFFSPDAILSSRKNIVLSTSGIMIDNARSHHASSINQALNMLSPQEEVLIMGGVSVYESAFSLAQRMYLTLIKEEFHGDAFFPTWDQSAWQLVKQENFKADKENPHNFSFLEYNRV